MSDSRKLRFRDDSSILVILESPGTNEVLLNRVATGATGSNLCVLLEFLRQKFRGLNNKVPPKFLDRFLEEDFCYEKVSMLNVTDRLLSETEKNAIHKNDGKWYDFAKKFSDNLKVFKKRHKKQPILVISCGSFAHKVSQMVNEILDLCCVVEIYHPSDSGTLHVGLGNKVLNLYVESRFVIECLKKWRGPSVVYPLSQLDDYISNKPRIRLFKKQLIELLGEDLSKEVLGENDSGN